MSRQEAIEYAKEINRKANFDYGVNDAPNIIRRLGPVGQVALQFQKYPIKEFELMADILKECGTKEGFRNFALPMLLLAGIFEFPFEDILKDLAGFLGYDFEHEAKKAMFDWAGKDPLKQRIVKTLSYGALSNLGIDVSSRTGMADIVGAQLPKTKVELLAKLFGPAGSTLYGMGRTAAAGDPVGMVKALSPSIGNALQAYFGEATTRRGRVRTRYASEYDRLIKALGFMPTHESRGRGPGTITA